MFNNPSRVLEEAQSTWERCPDPLRYDRFHINQGEDEIHQSGRNNFTVVSTYLDYLYSRFLLIQYLARHVDESYNVLLETARQILSTVVKATTYRASLIDLSRDYSWIVCALLPLHPL